MAVHERCSLENEGEVSSAFGRCKNMIYCYEIFMKEVNVTGK